MAIDINPKYDITNKDFHTKVSPTSSLETWQKTYKDHTVDLNYDAAAFSGLVNPDDCLVFVGPPRMDGSAGGGQKIQVALVGCLQNVQYSESAGVIPLKTLGSRLHLFSRTNQPVNLNLTRLMVYGPNLFKVLYQGVDYNVLKGDNTTSQNNQLEAGTEYASFARDPKDGWIVNLGSDIFRIPVGIGIVFNTPKGLADKVMAGAVYIENCQITSNTVSLAPGGGFVADNVSLMGDRVLPWKLDGWKIAAEVSYGVAIK